MPSDFRFGFHGTVGGGRVSQAEFNGGYSAAPCISERVMLEQ
ncbi:hypothetical protein [Microbacterium pumilum]